MGVWRLWGKAVRDFLRLTTSLLRHSEAASGWIELAVRLLVFVGLLGTGAAGLLAPSLVDAPKWFLAVAYFAIASSVLFFIAGVRLQRQVYSAEKRLPHNRDALITAITEVEQSALQTIIDHEVQTRTISQYPGRTEPLDSTTLHGYLDALDRLLVQGRIAGPAFDTWLRIYQTAIGAAIDSLTDSNEHLGQAAYESMKHDVMIVTAEVLRLLDEGQLYRSPVKTKARAAKTNAAGN